MDGKVTIPAPKPGFKASFEKIRPREVWDFAMASLAMGLQMEGNTIQDARLVFGGISGKPYWEHTVENFLKGKTVSPQVIAQAQAVALAGKLLEIKTLIVMPENAPKVKVEATRGYGAEVVTYQLDQDRAACPP